jgi:hypothetical protein
MYTYKNTVIIIPKSPATYRHRKELREDGLEWDGQR